MWGGEHNCSSGFFVPTHIMCHSWENEKLTLMSDEAFVMSADVLTPIEVSALRRLRDFKSIKNNKIQKKRSQKLVRTKNEGPQKMKLWKFQKYKHVLSY